MARMIPATISAETLSTAERELFLCLEKSLNDSYTVFHSYNLLSRTSEGRLIDAEIDFLVLLEGKGLVVLEVKGGEIRCDGSGNWYQNDMPMKKAHSYRRATTGGSYTHTLRTGLDAR